MINTSKGKLPVKYGWKALRRFGELTERDMNGVIVMITEGLSETWKGWSFQDLYTLLYCGFWYGALREGIECAIAVDDIEDMLDEDPRLTVKISEVLVDDFTDMFAKEGGKKK